MYTHPGRLGRVIHPLYTHPGRLGGVIPPYIHPGRLGGVYPVYASLCALCRWYPGICLPMYPGVYASLLHGVRQCYTLWEKGRHLEAQRGPVLPYYSRFTVGLERLLSPIPVSLLCREKEPLMDLLFHCGARERASHGPPVSLLGKKREIPSHHPFHCWGEP